MGISTLPVGYRFEPTGTQLINDYLLNKITGKPLPMEGAVTEFDPYNESQLLEIFRSAKDETNMYFFVQLKKKSGKGSRIDRTVGKNGNWNSRDSGKHVFDDDGNKIGLKRSLDYENKLSIEHGAWNMKEYSLHADLLTQKRLKKDYVLCVLKKKSGGKKRPREDTNVQLLELQSINSNVCEDEIGTIPEQQPVPDPMPESSMGTIVRQTESIFGELSSIIQGPSCNLTTSVAALETDPETMDDWMEYLDWEDVD